MQNSKIIFFDIDGTLLKTEGAGRKAFLLSLQKVFGYEGTLQEISFWGATDLGVLQKVLPTPPSPPQLKSFFNEMANHLRMIFESEPHLFSCYPGVAQLVEQLHRKGFSLGVITGNARETALVKLQSVGLDPYLQTGGFGDDHHDRNQIAGLALERAEAYWKRKFKQIFHVGDTPKDIFAAKSIGGKAVAVATGNHSKEELLQAGAHQVFDTLEGGAKKTVLDYFCQDF